jgi:signal transduction histidine kinase
VIREGERLKRLVEDILDVSRIEAGNLSYNMQKVRIGEVISEVIEEARLLIQENEVKNGAKTITIDSKPRDGSGGTEILLDRCRIVQALTNILSNSIKFTKEGLITIETYCSSEEKACKIRIIDAGTGIHPEILPRLFNKFATRTAGDNSLKQGTGLGLFISRSIIRAHGGEILAHNNENGKGATFVITLPLPSNPSN